MAVKFLDNTGLGYFWSKIKSWVTSRGYITSSGSITGNAATATKLGTSNVGASNNPIYLNAGVPKATGGSLAKTIQVGVRAGSYSDMLQTLQSDNNNYRSCTIRCENGNGYNTITLGAHNESNSAPSGIYVKNTNGTITAGGPHPASDANDDRLATTKWVNNKGYITSSGSITGNAATASAVAWSGVTGKPTTLSGYGITDAKIANGTITLGSSSITPLTSHQDISGKVNKSGDTMTGDLTVTTGSANQIRLLHGNYSILLRNDGWSFWILQTASGDPWGIWNNARPFYIDLSSGLCYINGRVPDPIPVGSIIYHASSAVPANYLICNGGAVSRTTYASLFAVIGTTFGAGDGSSTFNVPNLIGRFPEGNATPGTVHAAGLPNITGYFESQVTGLGGTIRFGSGEYSGCCYPSSTKDMWRGASTGERPNDKQNRCNIDASKSNAIYGKSSTVQPPALTLVPCIRYA